MPAALIERLLHYGHIVDSRGNRYRLRYHAELPSVFRHQATMPTKGKRKAVTAP